MAIDYEKLMAMKVTGVQFRYSEKETMLYALTVGMGRDPMDEKELCFVLEQEKLKTLPTMATVLTRTGLMNDSGLTFSKVLHGEQRLVMHRPLPPEHELIADGNVVEVYDHGEKGAVILTETRARSATSGEPIFTIGNTIMARADGGFGGSRRQSRPPAPPNRAPDAVEIFETSPNQALFYRLNGDRNMLHASPKSARQAGFSRPILHGLCSYGIACRAIVKNVCEYDSTRIRTFDVRLASPVFPGEVIATDIWVEGDSVFFQGRAPQRDIVILSNGFCSLGSLASSAMQ